MLSIAAALRAIIGLPLVLVAPGAMVTVMLLQGRRIGLAACILLSLGLSLCILALDGLVLNFTPWGLQTGSWLVSLGLITAAAAAAVRIRRTGPAAVHQRGTEEQGILLRWPGLAMLLLGLTAGAGALALSSHSAHQQQIATSSTQLWILPDGPAASNSIVVGVRNSDSETASYRLEMVEAARVLQEWSAINLTAGQQWETRVIVPSEPNVPVEANLYRLDAPEQVYRHVVLWPSEAPQ